MEELEKVQRREEERGVIISLGYTNLSYEERLKKCGQTTLERRRSKGNLVEVREIINAKEGTNKARELNQKRYM